jgi:hypothetical protein
MVKAKKVPTCSHPPTRLYSWFAYDLVTDKNDWLCIACCACGARLKGGNDEYDMLTVLLRSVDQQLASAIETRGYISYAEAKAYVQTQSIAGEPVWAILDARYQGRRHP